MLVLINRVADLTLPYLSKPFVDEVMTKRHQDKLPALVVAVFLAMLVQATTAFLNSQLLSKEAQRMMAELRQRLQQHVGRLPVSFYDSNRTGVLVSRIMNDVEGIRNLMGSGLVELLGALLTASIAFFFLMHRNAQMTLIVFTVLAVFILIAQAAFKKLRPLFRERSRVWGEISGRLTESIGGVRVVKGYGAEQREAETFSSGVLHLLELIKKALTATGLLSMASTAAFGAAGGVVMLLSGHLAIDRRMTPGDYVQYTMFLAFMVAPLIQIVNTGTQLTEAIAGLDRTLELLGERDEYADSGRTYVLEKILGEVRFEDVQFEYAPDKMVLHCISFDVQPGTTTALVGSSGSGKSTIMSLICGFHKPKMGRVLVDGVDLSTVTLTSYRSQLGVVLQESFLFDGSIRDNVLFSRPSATEENFIRACRIACVEEFAQHFPEGYDTIIGERGVKLSGGQRQRLSIARAILADPRILILDEATSSLDSESEIMIQQGLSYLMKGRTTFIIAHRLSTICRADQIFVVEKGRIVERGTHAVLYASGGRYYDLYTRQHELKANLFLAP
jgi:subfamily B ATP-binding cassette protein MsbA